MEVLRWKTRIAVLWIFMAVAMSAAMVLFFMGPGVIEKVMAGEIEGMQISDGLLVFFALLWLIPLIMAMLCLTLRDVPSRWTNFVLGIIFAIFWLADIIGDLTRRGLSGDMLMVVSMIVVAALIAWQAWRLPKQES